MILDFPPESTFQVLTPQKRLGRVLIWTKKSFFEDFYIKSFNWKRKRSNSNFQVKCEYQTTTNIAFFSKVVRKRSNSDFQVECEYQTTTNIAFLCRMVRIPFLLCVSLDLPTRKCLSGIDSPKKARSGLDLDQKNQSSKTCTYSFELEKKTVKFQFSG